MRILLFIWRYLPPPFHWLLTHLLNPHFLVGLVAVVLDRKEGGEPRVLLFEHTYRRKIPWGLPTGWLKRGERAKEAIVREIHEESGLRAEVEGVLTVESALPYGRVDLVFRCRIV
ncbi:MAG: NUDIX domain-containing protein, partial [Deltaproteobacteria bacterium]